MRAFLVLSSALALSLAPAASYGQQRDTGAPVRVQLDSMPLGALVTLLMRDVMGVPYVIAADVLNDPQPVSVNLSMPRGELPVRVVHFLRSIGLTVQLQSGTVYVSRSSTAQPVAALPSGVSLPSGSPLTPPPHSAPEVAPSPQVLPDPPSVFAVIEPAHKPVGELADVLDAMLPRLTVAARQASERRGTGIVDQFEPSSLVLAGSESDIERALQIVRAIDKPRPTVEIRAVVFEVRDSSSSASALSLLARLGGFDLATRPGAAPGEQFVRIASGGFQAILSATRGDGRFRIVAEPSLAALSGSVATINAGAQVPTLGSVSFDNGVPVRSIIYRDSGVSLSVRPIVRGGEIELAVTQERSSFAKTTTGVDDSPTLNKSSATAQVAIRPGETIAIAGLHERSEGSSRSGFLGGLLGSRERSKDSGQLLLLIQADLAEPTRLTEPTITILPQLETPKGGTDDEA